MDAGKGKISQINDDKTWYLKHSGGKEPCELGVKKPNWMYDKFLSPLFPWEAYF